ncbi:hypothetical protein D918_04657 [Trichuris suis]|nr:hypothetical protein D918_04657 [Trichuris suis]
MLLGSSRLIVHQVFPEEVAGRQAEVLNVDLYTIKDSDLSQLKGHFSCECYGNCKVFGFCMWFVVDMPAGVTLDTSPYAEVTHWLQIAMYIKPFKVDQGKVIAGSLSVQQHPEDERNFCATLEYKYNDGDSRTVQFTNME